VIEGTIASGGWPLTVSEARLAEARVTAHATTGLWPDATGAAGLAGSRSWRGRARSAVGKVAVLFTGVER